MGRYSIIKNKDVQEIIVDNGIIKLVIVPEQGGRIVEFSKNNINILFRNEKYKYSKGDIKKKRNQENWINFGGYKGWCAPQGKWGWPPFFEIDLNTFSYKISKCEDSISIELKSIKFKELGLQFIREIIIKDNCDYINIKETIVNVGNDEANWSVWANTQVLTSGYCEVGLNSDPYFGGVTLYQDFDMPTTKNYNIYKKDNYNNLKVICDNKAKFKIGVVTDKEEIKYYYIVNENEKLLFTIKFKYEGKVVYPHGSNVEIFVDDELNYSEIEVLGGESKMKPGESKSLELVWRLESI